MVSALMVIFERVRIDKKQNITFENRVRGRVPGDYDAYGVLRDDR